MAVLLEVATRDEYPVIRLYSLITLVELGDRSDDVAQLIITTAEMLMTLAQQRGSATILDVAIQQETMRALSYFAGNNEVRNALIDALQGRRFIGMASPKTVRRYAMCAIGAFGDPSTREYLEYWAAYGDETDQRVARVALELFGEATFDNIFGRVGAKICGVS